MNLRDYYELFRYLMDQYCLSPDGIVFVDNIADWCREEGVPEPDRERPVKLILEEGNGCRMLIKENITEEIIKERINAMRIRGQLKSVTVDRADLLNTDKKRLAYLFLSEYATSIPDLQDELLADDWAFDEMERLGFFKQ